MSQKPLTPYPISCQLICKNGNTFNGNILKVSLTSLLVSTETQPLLVNTPFQIKFLLPFIKEYVDLETVVFKTYDSFKGKHNEAQPGTHTAELVIKTKGEASNKHLLSFLEYIQANS